MSLAVPKLQIIAHRGSSAAEPENTMAAFARAKRDGAHSVELDARVCGSGELVVFHDRFLDRLCGVNGEVSRTPLPELRKLRVNKREKIPTLDDVLRSDDRPRRLVIELKTDRWNDVVIAAKVAKLIAKTNAEAFGPIVISSFNPLTLLTLRRVAPNLPRALLAQKKAARPLRNLWFAPTVGPRELHLEGTMITERTIAAARKARRFVIAWTINNPEEGARLAALGVDGLITDVPELFL